MAKIIIDAEGAIFGRLCSYAAKKALEGNEIIIINSKKIFITGRKKNILGKFRKRRARGGSSQKGPNYPKLSYMILKRGIRGMLPDYRRGIGKEAFSKIKCYDGFPEEFKKEKTIKFESDKNNIVQLGEILRSL